jgi:glycosyltransferase involved in cell wall biosynthesis
MFSVIIPLYNKADYISKTVQSVLNQTVAEFEIIIVDDGSTDNSLEIVESFRDERIRIIRQENNGVSSARNTGIVNSKYEYVALLDADDYWTTTFLEEISSMIRCIEADMYGTNYFLNTDGNLSDNRYTIKRGKQSVSKWFLSHLRPVFFTSSVVIRKQIFEKTGMFDTRISYGEDMDMWIRIASCGEIAYSSKRLVVYNKTKDSLTTHLFDGRILHQHLLNYLNKYDLSKPEINYCASLYRLKYGLYYYLFVDSRIFKTGIIRNHLWKFPLRFSIFYMLPIWCGRFLYKMYFKLK